MGAAVRTGTTHPQAVVIEARRAAGRLGDGRRHPSSRSARWPDTDHPAPTLSAYEDLRASSELIGGRA